MKNYMKIGLLALAAGCLSMASAHAQNVAVDNGGNEDLVLSFSSISSGTDMEIDLGLISQFEPGGADATGSPVTLTLVNTNDLITAFGSGWNSASTNVFWAAVGDTSTTPSVTAQKYNMFATDNAGAPVSDYGSGSNSASSQATNILNMVGYLSNDGTTAYSPEATIVPYDSTQSFSADSGIYTAEHSSGNTNEDAQLPPTGFFGNESLNYSGFLTQTDGGTSTAALYVMAGTTGKTGTYEGTFSVGSGGVTFDSAAPVPEPSTWASIGLGALALIGMRRGFRRRA